MKFCKDCKFCVPELGETPTAMEYARCSALKREEGVNLVTGLPIIKMPFCEHARKPDGGCQLEGKLFEPRVPTNPATHEAKGNPL